ncbi:hypothetical protein PanWU01x14_221230 [Parasponia andersonii]|uniref:Uncharacterized protein n=1 Tax=Parasponia andersonii TaxID=3476 RepID=A0A2P5BPL5_PARAD|nr:hypothetical protein PanWU01x14_221230 [Parasponia andersonii]
MQRQQSQNQVYGRHLSLTVMNKIVALSFRSV